jgi:aspartyl/asparaginyl beta-hydroxylase (cupin superfamily)
VGWDWFSPAVQPIIETILRHYPRESVVMMCQIANLKPGGHIAKHFDAAPLLCASHRVHVPLITWPEVAFYIDDQAHHFEAAVAFELNNQRLHEVHHRGTRDRLHLILDVLPGSFDRVHGRWAFAESPASPAGHL